MIEDGSLDLAAIRARQAPSRLASRRLCPDRLWVAVPEDHPLALSKLSVRALASFPLISFSQRSFTRRRVLHRLGPLGSSVSIEVDGRASAISYVQRGLGVAFLSLLPRHLLDPPGVVLRDVTRFFEPAYFYAIWSPRPLLEVERYLVDRLVEETR